MPKLNKPSNAKVAKIKSAIKAGTYNWQKGIEGAANKIAANPEVLLWR